MTSSTPRRAVIVAVLFAGLGVSHPVAAQTGSSGPGSMQGPSQGRPERPYRGLFGGGSGAASQMLSVSAQFGGGYDDNILASEGAGTSPDPSRGTAASSIGQAGGALTYSLGLSRVSLGASANASFGYYPTVNVPITKSFGTGLTMSAKLTPKTELVASTGAAYQPRYLLGGLPSVPAPVFGEPAPVVEGQGVLVEKVSSVDGAVQLSYSLARRLSVNGSYTARHNTSESGTSDLTMRTMGAWVRVGLAKDLGIRLGYGETSSDYGTGDAAHHFRGRNIDAGVDFARALSLTRRTTLGFSTGLTAVADEAQTRYRALGDVRVNRELGRSWSAWGAYSRSVNYDRTFVVPVFSDGVASGVSGLLSRRLQLGGQVGTSFGSVGFSRDKSGYTTAYGSIQLQVGLMRNLGVSTSYTYYRYTIGDNVELRDNLPRRTDRQSLRVSLSVWTPIFSRTRRPDASR